ncbi:D-2-hydroxyglutarate dehydrogenase YdiJ [Glaciecola petra]|uniref:FAD-binding and (Fe-S)-binding domain-containing protein n=1 Tax=Glaciecola petra TaxID=3075602 RepID=A0ABU2ZN99_9ALTE|nr:FAD-binding and (Fe-S)-binding domain-containing protein [Aestuariibacter sp. P117]MDT0594106.1 FAD-binding and (Fe-S)-binding domain-containing protein [Aestuariibacter sp. P117]
MNALPKLLPDSHLNETTLDYVNALKNSDYQGDIEYSYSSRLAVATDNSIYQKMPQAVLHPRNLADLQLLAETAKDMPEITFSARGGGTGTNGQSLTPGVVVDTSRYMNAIIELNIEQEWVKVQSGLVKDALNDYLAPYGYFFAPDLSTSNRATIGGMVSTDASGQGSLVYGKTSDHLLALTAVLANGDILNTAPLNKTEAQKLAQEKSMIGEIYHQALSTCVEKRSQIIAKFPRLNRFLTGYDLEHTFDDKAETIDVGRLIAGAEGSLAFIAEVKLNISKIPSYTKLVNIKYDDFESALRHAPSMIAANATSVETVDSKVLNLARTDLSWSSVATLIEDVPNKTMNGLNMVEYNSESEQEISAKIKELGDRLNSEIQQNNKNGVIGFQVIDSRVDIKKIYAMRKKAVGLLGKTKGRKKPLAFTEDTAVPPENLADFIMEFRDLLDSHGLEYGMFGHVDAGVLHVRPALDLCDPEQELLLEKISDQVVSLVAKYGGLMWGEHGKGYRSQYAQAFFGDDLYHEICKIKAVFDPLNKMNPGKIAVPANTDHTLVQVSDQKRATFDRQIPISFKNEFESAMSCNGNGLCFNYDTKSPMCPSSKITADRRHSPKGRAGLIREWLFQLAKLDSAVTKQTISPSSFKSNIYKRIWNSLFSKTDFNHEVFDAMNGCLACKSCSSQCPVGVDVPDFRSKFLAIYYSRYMRPMKDYFVAKVETLAPLMAKSPRFFNSLTDFAPSKWLLKNVVGYVDTPLLSSPTLKAQVQDSALYLTSQASLEVLMKMPQEQRDKHVLIVQDPFTSFYDAEIVVSLVKFIQKIQKTPVILPFSPNGKPQHVKGFLTAFAKTAGTTSTFLNEVAKLGIPMVGADASLVLCYRDEYKKCLGDSKVNFKVLTISEWLKDGNSLNGIKVCSQNNPKHSYKLLSHCSEKTALPESEKDWQHAFAQCGLDLDIVSVGCCGMAGTYGHELEHLDNSRGIYDLSWKQTIDLSESTQILATGYSCRSQVKRIDNFRPKHPIEVLASVIS